MNPMSSLAAAAVALTLGLGGCTQEQTEQAAHPGQVTEGAPEQASRPGAPQPGAGGESTATPGVATKDAPLAPNSRVDDTTPGQSNTAPSYNPQPPKT